MINRRYKALIEEYLGYSLVLRWLDLDSVEKQLYCRVLVINGFVMTLRNKAIIICLRMARICSSG